MRCTKHNTLQAALAPPYQFQADGIQIYTKPFVSVNSAPLCRSKRYISTIIIHRIWHWPTGTSCKLVIVFHKQADMLGLDH
jgi:hypothetical protein